jgi:light-regulated signal transduction histidine kinase (bacteriophytochrome)
LSNTIQDEPARHAPAAAPDRHDAEAVHQTESARSELDAFSGVLSHDLRAPLRTIEGFSQLLLQQYAQQLDATGQDYLQRIHRASLRLGQMMEQLLRLAHLARDGVKSEQVDLSRMAEDILSRLRATAPERRAETAVDPDLVVTGDAALIRLSLENLLGNAWKFTSGNAVADIFFGRAMDNGVPALCVRDNGAGFDQKYADKLFRPFQRLHSANEFEGSGMGLAMALRVVHAHGGHIWAKAQPGQGAAFFFTLPGMAVAPGAHR